MSLQSAALLSTSGLHELENHLFKEISGLSRSLFTWSFIIFSILSNTWWMSNLWWVKPVVDFWSPSISLYSDCCNYSGKRGISSRTNTKNGISPGRVGRLRVRPCKRTPLCAVGEDRVRGLIYVHKSMGKVLVPSVLRVSLRLASSCKAILSLSEPAWPHSASLGLKVMMADMGDDDLHDPGEYSYNALCWPQHTGRLSVTHQGTSHLLHSGLLPCCWEPRVCVFLRHLWLSLFRLRKKHKIIIIIICHTDQGNQTCASDLIIKIWMQLDSLDITSTYKWKHFCLSIMKSFSALFLWLELIIKTMRHFPYLLFPLIQENKLI